MNSEMFTDNEKRSRIFRKVMDGHSLGAYREFIYDLMLDSYPEEYEKHHIIPKCFGGSDHKSNIICLEPSAHLEAHRLLLEGVKRLDIPEFIKPMQMAYNMMKGRIEAVPYTKVGIWLLDVMADMSKAEAWFFKLVRRNMNINTNTAHIQNNLLSKSDQQKKKLAYKSLKSKDLVRRVQREIYMVNPDAIMLPAAYEENKKVWDKL